MATMPRNMQSHRRWIGLCALAGFAIDLGAFWPGLMSFDSAYAWWQARGGETTDITSPTMIALWRGLDAVYAGPGLLFALHLAMFWSGLALVAHALRSGRLATLILMGAAAFAPVVWVLRAHVWTDVGLMAALTLAVGALANAQHDGHRAWLALALPALFYATALRHNALPALLPLVVWCGWLMTRDLRAMSAVPRLRAGIAASGVLLILFVATAAIDARVQRQVPMWPSLAQWDLAAISVSSGQLLLPAWMVGPGMSVAELGGAFRGWSNTPMLQHTQHGMRNPLSPMSADELAELRSAWFAAIRAHPRAWFAHRWRLTRALFGTHARDWPRELVFVDQEFAYRDNPPIAPNTTALHRILFGAAERLRDTIVLAAWPYLLIGLCALPLAWRRRAEVAGTGALVLLASAWAYALPLTVFAPAAELRYLGWSCLASVLAAACIAVTGRRDLPAAWRAARLRTTPMTRITMAATQRYYISIENLTKARGEFNELSFHGTSPDSFAALLQEALREPTLWRRWRDMQPDPDAIDPGLGVNDPAATVSAHQSDLHVDVEVATNLPHAILRHRLELLIGHNWKLRDVRSA